MPKVICGVMVIFFWLGTSNGFADMFSPSHSCYKPSKPYQFNSEWEVSNFKSEVENYRNCINDFVDEQNDAIRKHKNAAEDAIDDWNNFVSYELN
jgi:hypothetical protein